MLNLTQDGEIIAAVAPGSQFTLPNGDVVSPAYIGWSSGEYMLVQSPAGGQPPEPTLEEIAQSQRQAMHLSFAQLLIGLVEESWITEAEGEAWLVGQLPEPVATLIASLPVEQRFPAKAKALRPFAVERLDPIVVAMGQAQGMTADDLDNFFRTYIAR